jgi:cell division protein ZapA (FtsZ GTPase activity inhibitor)
LRTDLSDEALSRLTDYVDGKMRELDPKGALPPNKVSILASLTIAGELLEERERADADRREIARRLEHLHKLLDAALGGG